MEKYKYFLKNTALLMLSGFSSKILIFLMVPIYTSVLTTSEFGASDIITTTVSLLLPILSLNICEAIMRFAMDKQYNTTEVVSVGLRYVTAAVLIAGAAIAANCILVVWDVLAEYALYTFLFFTSHLIYQFSTQLAKGLEDVAGIAIAGILSTVLTIGLLLLLLLRMGMHLDGFFMAYILGYFVPSGFLLCRIKLHKYLKLSVNRAVQTAMVRYSFPLIFNTLGWWVNNVSDRYIVTWLCGLSINGIYSVSYKIPSILNAFQNLFHQAWQISAIKEHDGENETGFYQEMLINANALMALMCSIVILLSKVFARFLYAKDFYAAWMFVPMLLLSSTINNASGVIGPILSARNDTKSLARAAWYGAVTNVVLNFVLVYFLGAQGAAIATAISSLAIFECRVHDTKDIFHQKSLLGLYTIWGLLLLQSCAMILGKGSLSYIIQTVLLFGVVVLSRKTIFTLFNGMLLAVKSRMKKSQ